MQRRYFKKKEKGWASTKEKSNKLYSIDSKEYKVYRKKNSYFKVVDTDDSQHSTLEK